MSVQRGVGNLDAVSHARVGDVAVPPSRAPTTRGVVVARRDSTWLRQFGTEVARALAIAAKDAGVEPFAPSDVVPWRTTTDGWYVDVARAPSGGHDRLQIWFDRFAGAPDRCLSVCFKTANPDRAELLAEIGVHRLGTARRVSDNWIDQEADPTRMTDPLPADLYGQPFAEIYNRAHSWSFYTVYWADVVRADESPPPVLVTRATQFFADLLRAVVATRDDDNLAYPEADRSAVRRHLARERSKALARRAKARDSHTCQVCGINFGALYGPLGSGYAEVHHRIPLSSPGAPKATLLQHLVTVCANCHRMLHLLPAGQDGIDELRARLTHRWPPTAECSA